MEVPYIPRIWTMGFEVITLDNSDYSPDKRYHCSSCNECLASKELYSRIKEYSRNQEKYCWECLAKLFGQKCVGCEKAVTGENELIFIFYDNRAWHRECFKCKNCGMSLEGYGSEQVDESLRCAFCGNTVKFQSG